MRQIAGYVLVMVPIVCAMMFAVKNEDFRELCFCLLIAFSALAFIIAGAFLLLGSE